MSEITRKTRQLYELKFHSELDDFKYNRRGGISHISYRIIHICVCIYRGPLGPIFNLQEIVDKQTLSLLNYCKLLEAFKGKINGLLLQIST